MQRRALLQFGGAISVSASALLAGCGGGSDSHTAIRIRGEQRLLHYDTQGNTLEWSDQDNWVRFYDASDKLKWSFNGVGSRVGPLNSPSGVMVLGERIYISDFANSRIIVLDRNGNFLFDFGESGDDKNDLFFVHEPVLGPDGLIYFCDALHHRVQVYDANGQWKKSIGQFGTDANGLNYPESLAFDADGQMHVVDSGNGRVMVFDASGAVVRHYGALGDKPGQMLNPEGIAIDTEGNVYVSDKTQCVLHIYDRQGRFKERVPVFLPNGDYGVPGEMRWRPDGALHVTASRDGSQGLIPRLYL